MLSVLKLLISQFSGSPHCGSPISETDDEVHNVFLNTQCMRYCDVIHIVCTYFLCFKMKPTNHTSKH